MRISHAVILAGLTTAALSGAAVAASRDTHLLTVPLPDGAIAKIEYHGSIAPKMTVVPGSPFSAAFVGPLGPQFAALDRMAAEMQRRADALRQRMDVLAKQPGATATLANYGNMPAGSSSYSMVTTSNGDTSCTRTVQVTSQGPGKPPKVVSNSSGDCSSQKGARPKAVPTA